MRRDFYAPILPLFLMTGLLLTGCSDKNPLNRQAVSGKVTLAGAPLDSGSIEFHPAGSTGTLSGAVVTNGSYSIAEEQGLPEGEYIVRISAADGEAEPEEMPGESNKLAVERIPPEFNVDSQVKIQVQAGQPNTFDFDIPAAAE